MKPLLHWTTLGLLASFAVQAETVTIEHRLGKTTLEQKPQRVVVIGVGALDALDSFGIEPVAVSKFDGSPDYLAKYKSDQYPSAGSLFEPDFETIYTQKPDLIVIGPRAAKSYDELSKIAPTIVFAAEADQGYWQSTQQQWRNLGKVFAIEPAVEAKIEQVDAQFKSIMQYNQQHKSDAMLVMSSGGNLTTFGANSRFSSVYKDFGFSETVPVSKESGHGDLISFEYIREHNPKTLLVVDRDKVVSKAESNIRQTFENDLVKATTAYKNGHIAYLDVNAWYIAISGVKATEQMVADMKTSVGMQ
ncbi:MULTISPECIES: iron chelate ABC transporter substrate-binding protein VctP [Vibrio]|uniref:iron chelate ABC transporter substrate-binding protein VctP n=1 Tax=Vibrio TaxID=662 RepID=UPI000BA8F405|nr:MULTISPECIES: iron chelate ABC transporter substrate-binding protein VctP [Vibrio]MDP4493643.1 iron chelate ABC transporter substrate-binding protein VctP [Vibrio sp. AH4]PAR32666.1 siderophore ABC transporter substrate-binding protein [Vibrio metoecus]